MHEKDTFFSISRNRRKVIRVMIRKIRINVLSLLNFIIEDIITSNVGNIEIERKNSTSL